MDKDKKQQIILIIIIPIFFLALMHMYSQREQGRGGAGVKEEVFAPDAGIDAIPMPDESMDFNYTPGEENPFTNLLQAYLKASDKEKVVEHVSVPMPSLVIEGMVWNTDKPQAIINGKVLNAGDIIDGVRIINIEKQGITIDFNGERVLVERKK
ncbi:MAG: general secretion pathway protein GspB [Candidatus Omnitrophica bacterium]|jgi:hypothetical protein|nr:general secretion pathway protein GspB [Candidatus Omnitrophota bacterium]